MPVQSSAAVNVSPDAQDGESASENQPVRADRPIVGSESDIRRYREAVEKLMQSGSSMSISNSAPSHAAVLFEKFFEHAKRHVRIFCWKLDADVFGDEALVRQAEAALLRGVKITVITQSTPDKSAFLDLLQRYSHWDSVTLLSAQNAIGKLGIESSKWDLNFATMDERALRVEFHRKTIRAEAAMNLPDYAQKLISHFSQIVAAFKPSSLIGEVA